MSRHTMFSRKPGRMVQKFNTGDWITNVPKPNASDRSFEAGLCQVIAIDGDLLTLRNYDSFNTNGYTDFTVNVKKYNFQRLTKQSVLIHPKNPDKIASSNARNQLLQTR